MTRTEIERVARRLAFEWWFAPHPEARTSAAGYLADLGEEFGPAGWPAPSVFRNTPSVRVALALLHHLGGVYGRGRLSNMLDVRLARATFRLHAIRQIARPGDLLGNFDTQGVWWPHPLEDQGDIVSRFKDHREEYPNRYFRSCCTRRHCRRLVEVVSLGQVVDGNVLEQTYEARYAAWTILTGDDDPPDDLRRCYRWSPLLPAGQDWTY